MVGSSIVKAVARMTLLYLASFAFLLLVGLGVDFAHTVVGSAIAWPARSSTIAPLVFSALAVSIPLAALGSLLFSLIYSTRHKVNGFIAALVLLVLSTALLCGTSLACFRFSADAMNLGTARARSLGEAGRILKWDGASVVLPGGPDAADGFSVLVPASGRMELVPATEGPDFGLPGQPRSDFPRKTAPSAFLSSLGSDIAAVATRLQSATALSPLALLAFCAGFSLMLVSCAVFVSASRWALVNLIFCFLAFWGLVRVSAIIYSPLAIRILHELLPPISDAWLLPAVMAAIGLVIALPGMLVHVAVSRRLQDE